MKKTNILNTHIHNVTMQETIETLPPKLAAETAWFNPFPPTDKLDFLAKTVWFILGNLSRYAVWSQLILPTTTIFF